MLSAKLREPNIVVFTREGVAIGAYQNTHYGQPQVRSVAQKKDPLDVHKEKEVFLDMQPKFVDANKSSMSRQVNTMLERFE